MPPASRTSSCTCPRSASTPPCTASAARCRPSREDHARLGVPSLPYSRQKVAAERLLDDYEQTSPSAGRTAVARLRPGLILQRAAGSALLRYGTPAWFPSAVLGTVPVLPLDRRLTFWPSATSRLRCWRCCCNARRERSTWRPSRRSPATTWLPPWAPAPSTCRCPWCVRPPPSPGGRACSRWIRAGWTSRPPHPCWTAPGPHRAGLGAQVTRGTPCGRWCRAGGEGAGG